jgi:hypothetical protein
VDVDRLTDTTPAVEPASDVRGVGNGAATRGVDIASSAQVRNRSGSRVRGERRKAMQPVCLGRLGTGRYAGTNCAVPRQHPRASVHSASASATRVAICRAKKSATPARHLSSSALPLSIFATPVHSPSPSMRAS